MRLFLLGLALIVSGGHVERVSQTQGGATLLAADRALAQATARAGAIDGFASALAEDAVYLHPRAPLLRSKAAIRAFLADSVAGAAFTWTPAYADVSADSTRGYTYGWTHEMAQRGKYLAWWQRTGSVWRLVAFMRTAGLATPDSSAPEPNPPPSPKARGAADPRELMRADSAFAAASLTGGARAAFLAFAADDAITLGGPRINHGKAAIGATFDGLPAGAELRWAPLLADVAGTGDLGYTVGEAVFTMPNADGPPRRSYSKYLTVWRRQATGEWRFVADGGNARPAP